MSNPAIEFENALLADRLALRYAMEHDSPEALQKYLEQHPDADRSKHTVKKSEGERGSAKDDDSKAETKGKDDKPKKLQTFQKARAGLMDHLKDKGWKMSAPGLKIPHATSPDGKLRMWFKPQAIWYSSGTKHDLQGARSIHTDIRSTDPEKVVQEAQRYAR